MATLRLGSKIICPIKLPGKSTTTLTVIPSENQQTIISGNVAYNEITVQPVTHLVDKDLIAANIRKDTTVLDIVGEYVPSFLGIEKVVDKDGNLRAGNTFIDLAGVITINQDITLAYGYYGSTQLTGKISFGDVEKILCTECCLHMCDGCINITSVEFNALSSIQRSGIFKYAFANCTNLKHIYFPSLNADSFGTYTDQFNNMLNGVSDCIVHFPMAISQFLSELQDVQDGFGGTNISVVYDLPAYERDASGDLVYNEETGEYEPAQ